MQTVWLIIATIALVCAVILILELLSQVKNYESELQKVKKDLNKLKKTLYHQNYISATPAEDFYFICHSCRYKIFCSEGGTKPSSDNECRNYSEVGSDYDE